MFLRTYLQKNKRKHFMWLINLIKQNQLCSLNIDELELETLTKFLYQNKN